MARLDAAGMKKGPTIFLQSAILLVGAGALAFLLWEPHVEGRNARASLFEIYFKDPFLAYAYLASTPFFTALYQAFKLLGYMGREKASSAEAVRAARIIRYCALAVLGFAALGVVFIMMNASDDRAGGVFMGILVALGSVVMAGAATAIERRVTR